MPSTYKRTASVSRTIKTMRIRKVALSKSVMVWVLVRERSTMLLKISVIRSSLRNKFRDIRMRKKLNRIMTRIRKRRMISRCRVILMGRCMIRKNQKKVNRTKANKHRNSQMNKWARLMTINVKKTSRTRRGKPKERKMPMSILRDSKKENRNLLTMKEKKTKKKEKVRTREKTKRTKTVKMRKNEAIGTITMIREIKSTSKRKMLKNTKEMKKT